MKLHNLPKFHAKTKRRVGRGGKRGSYSGRGIKGQKSRAGRKIRPAERDLIIRLPKLRGFKNKPKSPKPAVFNLLDLSLAIRSFSEKEAALLDVDFLKQTGLLPKRFRGVVKILGEGEISVPVTVSGIKVSKSAKEKIIEAGGSVMSHKV